MDTPTRQNVARLVQCRNAGLISSVEFFESLSELELEADAQRAHNAWISASAQDYEHGSSAYGCHMTTAASSAAVASTLEAGFAGHSTALECERARLRSAPSLLTSSLPQLLTESEADAFLRGGSFQTSGHSHPASARVATIARGTSGRMTIHGSDDVGESEFGEPGMAPLAETGSSVHDTMFAVDSESPTSAPQVSPGLPALLTEQQATAIIQQLGAEWASTSFAELAQVSSVAHGQSHISDDQLPVTRRGMATSASSAGRWQSRQSSRDSACSTSLDMSLLPPWSSCSHTPPVGNPYLGDCGARAASDTPSSPQSARRSLGSQSASSSISSFSRRSQRWEHQRAQKREMLRRQCDAKELAECSFRPEVRPKTARNSGSMGCTGDTPATRLAAPPPSAARQAARRWREQRDEDETRECTFAPDLSQSASSLHLSVRSMISGLSDTGSIPRPEDAGAKMQGRASSADGYGRAKGMGKGSSKAFVPATNPIAPSMACARSYASKNVFARLSDPHPEWLQESQEDNSPEQQDTLDRPSTEPKQESIWSPSKGETRAEAFFQFLERQNHFEEQRRDRLEEVSRCTAPVHHPAICTTSRKLVDRSRKRSEKDGGAISSISSTNPLSPRGIGVSTSHGVPENRSSTGGTTGNEPTFRPQINAVSARRAARSCSELSSGDARRREARRLELREEIRQERRAKGEDEDDAPFAPSLNTPPPEVYAQSTLRLVEDPGSYLGRVAQGRLRKQVQREVHLERKAEQELAECTFTPQVNKSAPAFVRQMAASYRSAKDLRALDAEKPKQSPRPKWQ